MPTMERARARIEDVAAWRQDIHAHPELMYDVGRTADRVAGLLREFGCDEVVTGIGRTGVVGVIHGRESGDRAIGLRAEMDALPIQESTHLSYASQTAGRMHACGHDGHTAMLLGAARILCETRGFAGRAVMVFQPAEEGGAGGRAMVEDGLMERFGIAEVYGMHNLPGRPVGSFALCPGPIMAAADYFDIVINGRGGHAAMPNQCIDPVLVGAQVVTALQGVVARNIDPIDACVISVTQFNAGTARNAIPATARLGGTIRTLREETRSYAEQRVREVTTGIAAALGATAEVRVNRGYPVTRNHAAQVPACVAAASAVVGADNVEAAVQPMMGAEDFSYMLNKRPGVFVFIGNGESAGLHNSAYDFDDAALPHGIAYWVGLVEGQLPLSRAV